MKVTLDFDSHVLIAEREDGDPKSYYGTVDAKGESNLLYAIKEELIAQGYDVIKKRMWKDGNLVDDMQQYVRTRKYVTSDRGDRSEFAVYSTYWAIEGINDAWNRDGRAVLGLDY